MTSVIRKSNIHIVMVVLGLFVYVIAVGSRLLTGQYVCDKPTVILIMFSITIMLLGSLAGFIVALVKRSKKIGVQSAFIAFLVFVLYFFFYMLATQCPGW
jgi:NhaP-type Na+/H+ or K+/H+ antiporter